MINCTMGRYVGIPVMPSDKVEISKSARWPNKKKTQIFSHHNIDGF